MNYALKKSIRGDANRIGFALLLFVVIGNGFALVCYAAYNYAASGEISFFSSPEQGVPTLLLDIGYYVAAIAAAIALASGKGPEWPLRRPGGRYGFWALLTLFCGMFAIMNIINSLTYWGFEAIGVESYQPAVAVPSGTLPASLYLIQYTLAPAVLEELLFRGAIMNRLRVYGDGFAILVSSLLFATAHNSLSAFPGIFAFALLLGFSAAVTDSLVPPMIMHFLNNLAAVFVGSLQERISGGEAVSYGGVVTAAVFVMVFFAMLGCVPVAIVLLSRNAKRGRLPGGIFAAAAPVGSFFASAPVIVYIVLCAATAALTTRVSWL